ncbi:MAG: hypothetical protein ABSH41_21965 [Syntrophobacteraceae bacterium]|jgi:hypothetical protein
MEIDRLIHVSGDKALPVIHRFSQSADSPYFNASSQMNTLQHCSMLPAFFDAGSVPLSLLPSACGYVENTRKVQPQERHN